METINNAVMIQTLQAVFDPYPDILLVTLFGSAATGTLRYDSDMDIAVASEQQLTIDRKTEIHMALVDTFNRPIDLIDLNEINGPILRTALCSGNIVIKHSVPLLASMLKKMWYNQADMMPLTTMIMERQIQRFIDGPADYS